MQAHAKVWEHVEVMAECCAEELAPADQERQRELVQDARLALMRIDPSRCDIRSIDDLKVLRTMLGRAMSKSLKKLKLEDRRRGFGRVPEELRRRLSRGAPGSGG